MNQKKKLFVRMISIFEIETFSNFIRIIGDKEERFLKLYRPQIHLPKSKWQLRLNVIGYVVFIAAVVYSLIQLVSLPAEVPIHFNFAGEADGWGSKYFLLLLPFITVILTLVLEALEKNPQMHNYPDRMNESNVMEFYRTSVQTLNVLKNGLLIIFGLLQLEIVLAAQQSSFAFGVLLPIFLGIVVIVPIVWHFVAISKIK